MPSSNTQPGHFDGEPSYPLHDADLDRQGFPLREVYKGDASPALVDAQWPKDDKDAISELPPAWPTQEPLEFITTDATPDALHNVDDSDPDVTQQIPSGTVSRFGEIIKRALAEKPTPRPVVPEMTPDEAWEDLNNNHPAQKALGKTKPPVRDTTDYVALANMTVGEKLKSKMATVKALGSTAIEKLITAPSQRIFAEVMSRVDRAPKELPTLEDLEKRQHTARRMGGVALAAGLVALAGKAYLQYKTGATIDTSGSTTAGGFLNNWDITRDRQIDLAFQQADSQGSANLELNATVEPPATDRIEHPNPSLSEGIDGRGVGPDGTTVPETKVEANAIEAPKASNGIEGRGLGPDGIELKQESTVKVPTSTQGEGIEGRGLGPDGTETKLPAEKSAAEVKQPTTAASTIERHVNVSSITLNEGENLWTKVSELLPPEATNTDIFDETARIMEANGLPVHKNTPDPFAAARQLQIGQELIVPPVSV